MNRARLLTLIGAAGLIVGAILPWHTIRSPSDTMTQYGFQGDGLITGIAGVLLLVVALLLKGKPGQRYSTVAAAVGLIVGLLAAASLLRLVAVSRAVHAEGTATFTIGGGLILTLVAALLACLGGLQVLDEQDLSSGTGDERTADPSGATEESIIEDRR